MGNATLYPQTSDETLAIATNTFRNYFPSENSIFLKTLFAQISSLFAGNFSGYQACDTAYHDIDHIFGATAAVTRMLDGHCKSGLLPKLTYRDCELCIAAILLHDCGYLKKSGDNEGTGAKYTSTHVDRSMKFAQDILEPFGLSPNEIRIVQSAIQSTSIDTPIHDIDFRTDQERFIACITGTGDILGQMAAPNYPEKLSALYREIQEGNEYSRSAGIVATPYRSSDELLRGTRRFYEDTIRDLFDSRWAGVYRTLTYYFENGINEYFSSIEANLDRIDLDLVATTSSVNKDKSTYD